MKWYYLLLTLSVFCYNTAYSQNVIEQFKKFYSEADFACYEQKIQQDLNKFDKWLVDSLPSYMNRIKRPSYRPGNVDLQKENKVFVLAVSLANTENYNYEDNIYNYLIIDSLRTFIIVCVDNEMNITGITDTGEPGTFKDLKDDFYYYTKIWKNKVRETIKNINKEKPDLILYCSKYWLNFLYIKDDKIYVYNYYNKNIELNEYIEKLAVQTNATLELVRISNEMLVPYSKSFNDRRITFYRFTGHTPADEVRICPPLSKER